MRNFRQGGLELNQKKKKVQAVGWATAHFALGHDTVHCIVTQGPQQACMDSSKGHDTAETVHDMVGLSARRATRVRGSGCCGIVLRYEWAYRDRRAAWPLGCIARQV